MNELIIQTRGIDVHEPGVDRGNEISVIPVNGKCLNSKVGVRGKGLQPKPHDHVTQVNQVTVR
jgi:hypothetical protein